MNLIKENEVLGNRYLTEVLKKDILAGLDYISKNPPPPPNVKSFCVVFDNEYPSEPVIDTFTSIQIPEKAKFLRNNIWADHYTEQSAFINSNDYFVVFFIDPNDIKKIEHTGYGTDRGDNELIDEVLDLLNAKFGVKF